MRTVITSQALLAVLTAAPLLSQEKLPPPPRPHENTSCLLAEFVLMRRNEIHNHKLVLNSDKTATECDPCNDFAVLTTHKLVQKIHFEPGIRLGASYTRDRRWTLEGLFLGIPDWEGSHTVHGGGTLSFPFSSADYAFDYTHAYKAKGSYHTEFYSAELNYWKHMTPRNENYFSASWILGVRYMYIPEKFKLTFYKDSDKSHYKIKTQNYMVGAQAGLDVQWNPMEKLSWDLIAKLGECINYARDSVFLGDYDDTVVLRHFDKHEYAWTFFTDISAAVGYQFTPHFNTHVGYQMIYLTGLALAPEQIDKRIKGEERLVSNGEAIVQGGFVGITLTF